MTTAEQQESSPQKQLEKMSLAVLLVLLVVFFLLVRIALSNIKGPWKNAPPGPLFFPIIGSVLSFVSSGNLDALRFPLLAIDEQVRRHGEVMRLSMGTQHTVFLSGLNAIMSFSVLEETTLRPDNPTLLEMYSDGKELGMGIGLGGERWREQRRFAARALREMGQKDAAAAAGRNKGIESRILQEVAYTIEDIHKQMSKGEKLRRIDTYFDLPNLNVIWELVAGIRYDYDDPVPTRQFSLLRVLLGESSAGPMTTTPWLKRLPPFSSIYTNIRRAMDDFRVILRGVIDHQRETFDPNFHRGYIDKFIAEQKARRGKFFTDEDLVINCQDLFIAGSETASKTLSSCLLHMILNPDIQLRIQEEIDREVGRGRPVTLEDRPKLPFTEAALMEVRRFSTPFPMAPPRTSSRDIVIDGYSIPAGVPVQMNIYSVLRGSKYFEQPHCFNPRRFLNEKGEVIVPDAFIPFGYGKRRCLGENLANVSNFLFFANLLQSFNFRLRDGCPLPSTMPCGGLTYGPRPFDGRVTARE